MTKCSSKVWAGHVVSLALGQHVHVVLAHSNLVLVRFQAVHEVAVESLTWVLLSILLWLGLLSILNWLNWLSLLNLLSWLSLTAAGASSTHDSSNGLVGNFRASSECHSCHQSLAESTHHSSRLSWGLSWWMSSWSWSSNCLWSLWTSWEKSSATSGWFTSWTSSSSGHVFSWK